MFSSFFPIYPHQLHLSRLNDLDTVACLQLNFFKIVFFQICAFSDFLLEIQLFSKNVSLTHNIK